MAPTANLLRHRSGARTAGAVPGAPHAQGPAEARTRHLVARAKRGDREAKRLVVEEHLSLVAAVAHRYRELGLPEEDLAQEGAIGLLEAIDRFDPAKGARFATYAHWRIRQSITHALTDRGRLLRLPKEILERRRLIAKTTSALVAEGATPTTKEIARRTGLSPAHVIEALEAPTSVSSLDAPVAEGIPLAAAVPDPAQPDPLADAFRIRERRVVDEAVQRLPSREREVIEAHYGFGRDSETLAEVGHELGVSETRVRALEQRALFDLAIELEPQLTEYAKEGRTT